MKCKFPCRGMTLIELMIVVAAIGIILGLAVPSYREQVAKGRRADATTALMQVQQYLERYYMENRTYNDPNFATRFPRVPATGAATYTVAMTTTTPFTTYLVTLTPVSGGSMDGDRCGSFTVDNFGRRAVVGFDSARWKGASGAADARAYCWAGG